MATSSATTDGGRSPRSSFDTAMEKADALLASTESILSSAGDDSESLLNSSSSDSSGAMGKGIPKTSGVIFNLVNAVVGAGVLAQPFCFKTAGVFAASLFLCATALFTSWSLFMMAFVGKRSGKQGYSEAVQFYFSTNGAIATDFFIAFLNFGTSIAYLDVLADIFCGWIGANSKIGGLFAVLVFILFPLCCIRTFDQLSFTSYLGSAIYGTFGIAVFIIFMTGPGGDEGAPGAENRGDLEPGFTLEFARVIPIQTLAFACHTVLFPVYSEFMAAPGATTKVFNGAVSTSIVLCCILYLVIGVFGSLTFGNATAGDILLNYSANHGVSTFFLQCVFAISLCFTYPLVVFPLRDSLDKLLMRIPSFERLVFSYRPDTKAKSERWYGETIVVMLLGFMTAVVLPSIEVIFGLTGSIAGTTLCFIIPSKMYLKSIETARNAMEDPHLIKWRFRAKVVMYLSIPLGFLGFLLTIIKLASEDQEIISMCGNVGR